MIPGNANPLLLASAAAADTAANITKSLRFNDGDSAYLSKTPSSAGNRKKFTFSAWLKKGKTSGNTTIFSAGSDSSNRSHILLNDTNHTLRYFNINSGSLNANVASSAFLRDHSAWYHIVIAVDTSQSTASDRIKIYLNGVQITSFSSSTYPSQNDDLQQNATVAHNIGKGISNAEHFDGYLADVYFIDGSQLEPTSFGAYDDNGVWQAAAYSGTFGTNGFHLLDFASESTVGHDSSGNENDFTANNISTTAGVGNDVLFDVPTNGTQSDSGAGGEVSGNYPTLNPLDKSSGLTLSNGNLDLSTSSGHNNFEHARATVGITSGKWYCEYTATNGRFSAGIATQNSDILDRAMGDVAGSFGIASDGTNVYKQGFPVSSHSNLGNTDVFSTNDVCGIAFDADNGTLDFYKNGSAVTGAGYTGLSTTDTYFFVFGDSHNGSPEIAQGSVNFGQRAFANSAPSNYKPLCTALLPTPTIADGSDYFNAVLYTGNNTARSITGVGHSPDWVWIKDRSSSYHILTDIVRGVGKQLYSNTGDSEASNTDRLTSFDSDGFSIAANTSSGGVNTNNAPYVAWCWDAGSSTASNTDGSITSSVRANQTAGFSIVSYSGSGSNGTIGHGLNAAPSLIITKCRNTASIDWIVYSPEIDDGKILILNGTNAQFTGAGGKYGTVGSSTYGVVEQTNFGNLNASGSTYIAYCFAPVAGYSAFGSYEGNGSSTVGPFISTGFRVNYLLVKNVDTASPWFIFDAVRDPENTNGKILRANDTTAEFDGGTEYIDFLSNGFKLRTDIDPFNKNGDTYIYWAIAENPFQANGGLAR